MLGRTDSRRRLLAPARRLRASASLALIGAPGLLAGRRPRAAGRARRWPRRRVTLDTPSKRGDIYDRSGTVVLATTVQRERLVAAPDQLTPEQRRTTVADAGPDPRARRRRRGRPARQADRRRQVRHPAPRPRPGRRRPDPRGDRRQDASFGAVARTRARAGLPAGRAAARARRLAAHLLGFVNREGGGQYGVEQAYQSTLAGEPRVVVAERDASGQADARRRRPSPRPGEPGTDLRLTIDAGLQLRVEQELLAAWVADKAKRASAVVMDPYTGEIYADGHLPVVRRQRLQGDRGERPGALHRPGRVERLRAGLGVQDDDRGGRPDERARSPRSTRIKDVGTLQLDNGKTKIDDADRKGMGWMTFEDGVAYSRNVVAAKVALGLGKTHAGIVRDPVRHVAPARLRRSRPASTSPARSAASSATRASRRGARSTSPTARSARASR